MLYPVRPNFMKSTPGLMCSAMESDFDFCVIGAGLFGSSAAKYASEFGSTVLVGPSEDARKQTQIYGAWHDEGRITSPWFKTFPWRELTRKSAERYRDIEVISGINFYQEAGFTTVNSKCNITEQELEEFHGLAKDTLVQGYNPCQMTDEYAEKNFPFLKFPTDMVGYHYPELAGYLSPRKLVLAQQTIAQKHGCLILDGNVSHVSGTFEKGFRVSVSLADGSAVKIVTAKNLILAPGAYLNLNPWFKDLISTDKKDQEPDLSLKSQTVAYLEVSSSEAERLAKMPTMVTNYHWQALDGTYILPPILYPNGKYYLKLGHGDHFEITFSDKESERAGQVQNWYSTEQGNMEAVETLSNFITQSLIPDLDVVGVHGGCCVTAVTPGKIGPYIDTLAEGVTLVCGGNGYGAKCCDEIGRLGATLAARNKWDSEISKSDCKIIWRKME